MESIFQMALHKARNKMCLTTPSKIFEFLPPLRRRGMYSPSTELLEVDDKFTHSL